SRKSPVFRAFLCLFEAPHSNAKASIAVTRCQTFIAMDGGAEPPGMGVRRVWQRVTASGAATEPTSGYPGTQSMPELPEVETTKRGLAPHLEGRRVKLCEIRQHSLRWPVDVDFAEKIKGARIEHLERRAKYLLVQ